MNNRYQLSLEHQSRGWVAYGVREIHIDRMLPDVMQIETTSVCNLRCVFCPYDQLTRPREHMSVPAFEELLVRQCSHVHKVGLHHFGEPFLNPELHQYVSICARDGIDTTISTNATRVTREAIQRVYEAGLSRLIISLDGFAAGTYERLRLGGNYHTVLDNIALLLEVKAELGTAPFIQVQFIQTPENEGQWLAFRDHWVNRAGVNQVVLRDERTHAGQRVRHDSYNRRPGSRYPCRYLWESLVILADGRVVPCCKDFDGKEVLGNVFQGDRLEDIWNGPRMQEMRSAHVSGHFESVPLCSNCGEWPGHGAMDKLESMRSFAAFRQRKQESRQYVVHKRDFE